MSVNGPSNLGTLLVQRIDSMLGNTIGQQSNLATGARPDAVTQPGGLDRPDPSRGEPQRSGQEVVDRSRAQQEQQAKQPSVQRGRVDARTAELLAQRSPASTETTQSAPTRLGFAAQTILSLLAAMPDQSPVVQGRKPLLNFGPDPGKGGNGGANAANGSATAGRGAAAGAGGAAAGNAALAGGAAGAAQGNATGAGGTAGAGPAAGNAGTAAAADADGADPNAALRGTTTAGSGGAGGAGGAQGATTAGQTGATTAGQTGAANTTQQTQAGQNQPGSAANAAANVRGTLLTGTNPIATQLGQALTQAVQGSGMFYESHLGNLAFGRGALPQILQEPQAQLNQTTQQAGAGAGNAASGSGSAAAGAAGSGATPGGGTGAAPGTAGAAAGGTAAGGTAAGGTAGGGTAAGASAGGASGSAGVSGSTGAAGTASAAGTAASSGTGGAGGTSTQTSLTLPGVDPQTHTLVRQQLDVLANQSFAWRGEVWPNADMDWEVARRDASRDLDGTEYPDHWASRLKVNLPMLGEVEARITLVGQQLIMHLVAPHSSDVLNTHANDLRGRISAQGLHLGQLSVVARDPHAGDEDLPAAVIDDIKEAQAAANQALAGFELAEGAVPAAEGIAPRETP